MTEVINGIEDGNADGVKRRKSFNQRVMDREKRHHWEVTSQEPGWEFESSGPHVPSYYRSSGPRRVESEALLGADALSREAQRQKNDVASILLLLFLYLLQGIPLGLVSSVPMMLQSRQVNYNRQALFSFAYWPFSLKLLWAPIVDSVYWRRLGRRKSWLVPTQYLIGLFMLVFGTHKALTQADTIMGDTSDAEPDVVFLTAMFFSLNFLAATQDIAVDGWALTMLSKRNVGHASTCNVVGQTAGFFIGYAVFLALESASFCNAYLRSEPQATGVVTLSDFVYTWGIIFMVTTTLVLLLKREVDESRPDPTRDGGSDDNDNGNLNLNVAETYRMCWRIFRLKPVITLVAILLTSKMAFAAGDGISGLKLIEAGVPKDKLALLSIPLTPVQVLLPWVLGKYTAGPRPMDVWMKAYPYKLFMCVALAGVVWCTPMWQITGNGALPITYYVFIVTVYMFHQVASYALFVSAIAFFARVSDPSVGGTYMTLLTTMSNMGGNWPVTVALAVTDLLTSRRCIAVDGSDLGACSNISPCDDKLATCVVSIDGYFVLIGACFLIGVVWWRVAKRYVLYLTDLPASHWTCDSAARRIEE